MTAFEPLLRSLEVDLTPSSCTECYYLELAGEARLGDHIAVRSVVNNKPDVIWHHGIFINPRRIVHMHPSNNISSVTMREFVAFTVEVGWGGGTCRPCSHHQL